MPRRLSDELNELRIEDNISGSTIVLHYRMPTTPESIGYTNGLTQRRKNKLVMNMGQTRQKYGAKILEGFRGGDFERMEGAEYLPMASDPKSEHYFPEWKEHIKKFAPDIIEALAIHVFESSTETEDPVGGEVEDEERDPEDEDPEEDPASPEGYAEASLEKN